jgi:predicted short-subunit dehydrogenase-like oxidoreductase (DUF2520 family)
LIKSISLIGSGNVATHLGKGFSKAGLQIRSVYSRSFTHAERLAVQINSRAVDQIADLDKSSDLFLICVSDDAILSILPKLKEIVPAQSILAHTSGSTASLPKEGTGAASGVLYPLQSFNKDRKLDLVNIPFLITADDPATLEKLTVLCAKITDHYQIISDEERLMLHVAAVFANNFGNHLFTIAEEISKQFNLEFDLLRPLIAETVARIEHALPSQVQTGPAIRNDLKTIDKHLKVLKNNPGYSAVYSLLTQSIIGHYQKGKNLTKKENKRGFKQY